MIDYFSLCDLLIADIGLCTSPNPNDFNLYYALGNTSKNRNITTVQIPSSIYMPIGLPCWNFANGL